MSRLATQLSALRTRLGGDDAPAGTAAVGVPGVYAFWNEAGVARSPLLYDSGLVIVGQGRKVGYLGGRRFEYDAGSCLVLGVPVPFECEVEVDPGAPLLGMRVDVDVGDLHALVARFEGKLGPPERTAQAGSGVEPLVMQDDLLDAAVRLLRCLEDPMDRQLVGPAAVEEIVYRVLRSAQGRVLYDLTRQHSAYANVARALSRMHRDYRETLAVEDLAQESAMSVSAFHRAFKQVTGDTPVQYLKKLRLLKAKALLVFEHQRVDEAAYGVGYTSPSQFSREFKRYFEVPPSEAHRLPYNEPVRA